MSQNTSAREKVAAAFILESKKICAFLNRTALLDKVIFSEAGSLLKSYLCYCAQYEECDEACINLLAAFVNALPLHKKQPNIRHLVLQFNIYFAKLVCATGKNEAFLRLVLVLWFSFTDSLPAKTRAHGFLKANPAKIVELCFHKLQKSGDFFTQMKTLELLQSLTQSIDDRGANYLNKINFGFAFDEVLQLKKMYLEFTEEAFFENSRNFLNHLNIVCKRDSNTFSIKVVLQEINGTKLKDNVDTWIDFDQQSLTISFFTSLKSLLQEGEESSETVGAKFVFVDNYNQVESCKSKDGLELVIVPREYRVTNAYFDQETSFRDLYHFKFLINDAPDRVTKLIDALIPRYNQRKRKINDCCQSDAGSMFSFATATNSGFSSPFVARKPLRDLNLSQPNVIEDDEVELSQENNLQPIVNPTTPPQKLRSLVVNRKLEPESSSDLVEFVDTQFESPRASSREIFSTIETKALMLDKENKAAQAHLDNENKVQKKVDKFKEKLLVNKIFDKERRENAKKLQIEKDNLEKQEKEAKNIEIENCEKEEIAKKLQIGKENDEAAKEVKVKVLKGDEQKQAKNAERIIQKVHPMQNDETQSDSQIVALTQGLNISSTNAELMQLSSPRSRATRPARKKPVVYILRDSEDSEPIAQEMISTSTNIPHDYTPCLTLNRSFKDPELPQPATKKKPIVKRQRRMAVSGRSKNPVVKTEKPHNTKTISCKTKKSARSGRPKKVAATTEDITINSATVKKCVPPPAEPRKPKITYTSIFGQGSTKKPIENPIIVAELNEENGLCDNMLSSPQRVLNVEVPLPEPILKMKKKDIVSEPPIIKALNKEKRPLEDKTDKLLPRAKRRRDSSMSESAISQVSFNMSMMENPLMKNFILDISNYSENLETIEDTTPDLQMQITPSIDGEIEPFIEDFESSASIVDSPVKFVFRPPVPKIKTLTKRVLESTLKVITETSTLDERLLNTTNLPDGLYNDLNLQFQAIAEQTARKIQQVNRKCDLNFNSVLEQMQQLKKCAAEKKTAISQLLDLVKQASSVKKKLIALDQKERKSTRALTSLINKQLIEAKRQLDRSSSQIEAVRTRSIALAQKAKQSAWKSHVDRIVNQINQSAVEMYEI